MAFSFDEINDYVSLADNAALTLPNGDWFIGGFVKLDNNTGTNNQYLLSWGQSNTPSLIIFIGEDSRSSVFPGEVVVQFIDDNGLSSGFPSTDDNQPFTSNTAWTYVGVGIDGTDLKIVIDGTVQTTFDLTSVGTFIGANRASAIKFGARDDLDSNQYLGGDMAEWAKWDGFPSQGILTALSNGFSPTFFKNNLKWHVPMIREYVETIASINVTNTGSTVSVHPPMIYPTTPFVVVFEDLRQTINGILTSATGLLLNTFDLTFTLNGILQFATLYAPASINEGFTIGGVLQSATGIYVPSIPWDQTVTAPVITASGQLVAAIQHDQTIAGVLLQATGTLDTGVWVIDQQLAGQLLSATGLYTPQLAFIQQIMGVYITPTGLIAATFTGEQLYTGAFTFETPSSNGFTVETPGSDGFTEE